MKSIFYLLFCICFVLSGGVSAEEDGSIFSQSGDTFDSDMPAIDLSNDATIDADESAQNTESESEIYTSDTIETDESLEEKLNLEEYLETANFVFEARGTLGMMHYVYEEVYGSSDNVKWADNLPFVGVGFTFGHEKFDRLSFDIYAQRTDTGKDALFLYNNENQGVELVSDTNANLNREDYAINLGWRFDDLFFDEDGVSVSLGYKMGKSNIGLTRRNKVTVTLPPQPIGVDRVIDSNTGQILAEIPSTTTTTAQQVNTSQSNDETTFETKGPSLGISYGYPVGERSMLGVNLAYTSLSSDYQSTQYENVGAKSTEGLTFGLSWSSATRLVSYGVSLDWYSYTMDVDRNTLTGNVAGSDFNELKEEVFSLKVFVFY